LQHKPANCFSFVLQYLGSSSVWPIILIIFFGLCKEPNNKIAESAAAAAAATHYYWPTRWRIFTDFLLLLLLQLQLQQMGLSCNFPNFVSNLKT